MANLTAKTIIFCMVAIAGHKLPAEVAEILVATDSPSKQNFSRQIVSYSSTLLGHSGLSLFTPYWPSQRIQLISAVVAQIYVDSYFVVSVFFSGDSSNARDV